MSTRCHIKIQKSFTPAPIYIYHHCDGYPGGVGSELLHILKEYSDQDWNPFDICQSILNYDNSYQVSDGVHGDEDYLYIIDCDMRTLKCYSTYTYADFDNLEDEVVIPDNVFQNDNPITTLDEDKDFDPFKFITPDIYWKSYTTILCEIIKQMGSVPYEKWIDKTISTLNLSIKKIFSDQ